MPPAIAHTAPPRDTVPSKPAALLAAARTLLPVLEAGRALDAPALREAMTAAFGASDADGSWVWRDAYEAASTVMRRPPPHVRSPPRWPTPMPQAVSLPSSGGPAGARHGLRSATAPAV